MMTRKTWLPAIALAALLLVVVACGQAPATTERFTKNPDGYVDITVEQLAEMLPNKDFTLVNVHIPYEGEIEQTDLHIPFDQIADHLDKLPDGDAPIVLYCRSGSMSTLAAKTLVEKGYTNVMEVDGGFNAWKAIGHKLLTNPGSSVPSSRGLANSPQILFGQETVDLGDLPLDQMSEARSCYHNVGDAPLMMEQTVRVQVRAGC